MSDDELLDLCRISAAFRAPAPDQPAAIAAFDAALLPLWPRPPEIDWRAPADVQLALIADVMKLRAERLALVQSMPECLPALKLYYRDHPDEFIEDWGVTVDPRNVEVGLPARMPFLLFPRQREWIGYSVRKWQARERGLTEKSRDMGMSWLAMALACTLCLHYDGMAIGFGSRKEEYVDKIGSPKSLFFKGRLFMELLPPEFQGGWLRSRDAPHMRLNFPETGSNISGEAGDNIGRGDRVGIYFVDEAAHLERPELVDAALSATTNSRQDISSVNGMANSFAQVRFGGKVEVFTAHWRADPRKDDRWYQKQLDDYGPVVVAQEVDIDYTASVEGILIPRAWVLSALDAHHKLGIQITGERLLAFDVADAGRDKNATAGGRGVLLDFVDEWSGKGSDIFDSVERVFQTCDVHDFARFRYDADGIGAGVRGDAKQINQRRADRGARQIDVVAYRGSEAVFDPEGQLVPGRQNQDFFSNRKAQAWWMLRTRFQLTHRAVTEGVVAAHDDLIAIDSTMPLALKLVAELSQPTYSSNAVGKIVVDKVPDGQPSPNLADAVVIRYAPNDRPAMMVTTGQVDALMKALGPRRGR